MKRLFIKIFYFFIKCALSLRYKITFKGLEDLKKENLQREAGILFLPNHPCQLDSLMTIWGIDKFHPRPAAAEYLFHIPGIRFLMKIVNALPVPHFDQCSNSIKRKRIQKVLNEISDRVNQGENFLFYPAGRLKLSGIEVIGGASGLHKILQMSPQSNIVLVRINGLWGSSFSKALTGRAELPIKLLLKGLKHLLCNFIFFIPRRKVCVEFFCNPKDFPYHGSRLEINQYLEEFYNQPPKGEKRDSYGEPMQLVSYSFYREKLPKLCQNEAPKEKVDVQRIPLKIREEILKQIANLANRDPASLDEDTHLANDLGLDSLDATELLIFLEDNYGVSGLYPSDLSTIATVMAIAAEQIVIEHEEKDVFDPASIWRKCKNRKDLAIPEGKTISEVFLKSCQRMKKSAACADELSGTLNYDQMKMRVITLANELAKLPEKNIGILLPASLVSNIVIQAVLLAKKVPVMINWTVGPAHLEHAVKISNIDHLISSWKFINNLRNVELGDISGKLLVLEDLRNKITSFSKIKAYLLSRKSPEAILRHFKADQIHGHDTAVMLFTSGTENLPKGVPLSHSNILSNLSAALKRSDLDASNTFLSMLPPFHSFGFCITGLLPLLSGLKVAYFPDPTNSAGLARNIEKWGVTLLCSPPSFLRSLLKAASPKQLRTLQLIVTGSEKTPRELFEKMESLGKELIEGYGITECSPILTINERHRRKGVGRPLDGITLIVVNPDTYEVVEAGQQGLILARGQNIFSGYFDYKGPSPFLTVNGQQYYNTGDLGYLDEEGFLTLSGRLKRFVKIGGEMISLGAVEEALLREARKEKWPLEDESASFAVCAIEKEGEKSQLILFTESYLTLRDANQALKKQGLSNLSKISEIRQMKKIPLTGTGKVHYRLLQSEITGQVENV